MTALVLCGMGKRTGVSGAPDVELASVDLIRMWSGLQGQPPAHVIAVGIEFSALEESGNLLWRDMQLRRDASWDTGEPASSRCCNAIMRAN